MGSVAHNIRFQLLGDDGKVIAELLWGLFETTVKLEGAQDRKAIHKLALLVAESLTMDS